MKSTCYSQEAIDPEVRKYRKFNYPFHPLLANRWSPRAMSGEEMTDEEILPLFEAARWAPSSYNNQPWRFIYSKRNTPEWEPFLALLVDQNKEWAKNASLLAVVISKNTFDHNGKPSRTHTFDAGSAWMSVALEATARGYAVHGMEGFDYDQARKTLEIPEDYTVEAMFALGKRAPKEVLPERQLKREFPNDRRPLKEIMMPGKFKK